MFDINILISWNKSINEWIQQLNIYTNKTDYFGLYILGEKWTELVEELKNVKLIDPPNITNYGQFINYLDNMENNILQLNKIVKGVITKDVSEYSLSNMYTYCTSQIILV